ncbi:MAG: hypothetical protein WHS87_06470 [Anaerolineales bacterium]
MEDELLTRSPEVEEQSPMQERFCEVSAEEVASSAAEGERSREAPFAPALGFVP